MIGEEELLELGYKRYPGDQIIHPGSDFFYQKRVDDERGQKYFVNLYHYSAAHYPNGSTVPANWMAEMRTDDPFLTFQIHYAQSIERVEELCERFFTQMGCSYHEERTPTK